ncbi:MAG: hypothetical protein RL757_2408 [Bacteroidota bacterium]|jgi:hypothetical protein
MLQKATPQYISPKFDFFKRNIKPLHFSINFYAFNFLNIFILFKRKFCLSKIHTSTLPPSIRMLFSVFL